MANPLVPQGSLNRLRASLTWASNPGLNITSAYLGKEGIRISLQGESTLYIPTMTGAVISQEPYMMVEIVANLLKTQALSNAYKTKMESDARLGDGTVRPDATTLGIYNVVNCSIKSMRELAFSGEDAGFVVTIGGYYNVNSSLFG